MKISALHHLRLQVKCSLCTSLLPQVPVPFFLPKQNPATLKHMSSKDSTHCPALLSPTMLLVTPFIEDSLNCLALSLSITPSSFLVTSVCMWTTHLMPWVKLHTYDY